MATVTSLFDDQPEVWKPIGLATKELKVQCRQYSGGMHGAQWSMHACGSGTTQTNTPLLFPKRGVGCEGEGEGGMCVIYKNRKASEEGGRGALKEI